MPDSKPPLSPKLRSILDESVLERLPVTFTTFFFDQVKDWDQLFPAEQNYFERLLILLQRTDADQLTTLFAPMRSAEQKMGVTERTFPRKQFTLEHVDFLNRSPQYPEWRAAVAQIFSRLDPVLEQDVLRSGKPRLVMIIAPADLPAGPDRMWLRIASRGKRVRLSLPDNSADYLPLLLTGAPRSANSLSIAGVYAKERNAPPYQSWVIEAGASLSSVQNGSATSIAYGGLEAYRKRLMAEVSRLVDKEKIRGPRQLGGRLKDLRILTSEGGAAQDPVIAEFLRSVLLAGNGTLLVNNTFVEWATMQAVRRARPSCAVVAFGIRNR